MARVARVSRSLCAFAVIGLGAASTAQAGTTFISAADSTLAFVGTSGADTVSVTNINMTDLGNPKYRMTIRPVTNDPDGAASGCTLDATQTLTCTVDAGFRHVYVATGTGDDYVSSNVLDASGVVATMRVDLGDGNDSSAATAIVDGEGGDDTLTSYGYPTYGGNGNDTLTCLDIVMPSDCHGGDGNDSIVFRRPQSITGGNGNDTFTADPPGTFSEAVSGGPGDDTFVGRDGNDHFYQEPGNDDYHGGNGVDFFHGTPAGVASSTTRVSVTADNSPGDGVEGESDNVHTDIEVLEGTEGNDRLDVRRVPTNTTLRGFGGDDTLIGSGYGDLIEGGPGGNTIAAAGGDDTISTAGPGGQVQGGDGNDAIAFSGAGTTVLGNAGDDRLTASGGAFFTSFDYGGDGNDTLIGNPDLADTYLHEPGDDTYRGGTAGTGPQPADAWLADTPEAPATVGVSVSLDDKPGDGEAGEADDVGSDIESLRGTDLGDIFTAASASGAVALDGRAGADDLTGSPFADTLNGGVGNDALIGGLGADDLVSGDGDDLISARDNISDRLVCGAGTDTIAVDAIDRLDPTCIARTGALGTPSGPATPTNPPAAPTKGQPGGGTNAGTPGSPSTTRVVTTLPRLYIRGDALVFNRFPVSTVRRGARCPRQVSMRTAFRPPAKGRARVTTVRVARALRLSRACTITATVTLPATARRLPSLSVSVRGTGAKARTATAKRIAR